MYFVIFRETLILLYTLHVMSGDPIYGEFYIKTEQIRLQSTIKNHTATSGAMCCLLCRQNTECKSVSFSVSSVECQLSLTPAVFVPMDAVTSPEWEVYGLQKGTYIFQQEFIKVYDLSIAFLLTCLLKDILMFLSR